MKRRYRSIREQRDRCSCHHSGHMTDQSRDVYIHTALSWRYTWNCLSRPRGSRILLSHVTHNVLLQQLKLLKCCSSYRLQVYKYFNRFIHIVVAKWQISGEQLIDFKLSSFFGVQSNFDRLKAPGQWLVAVDMTAVLSA